MGCVGKVTDDSSFMKKTYDHLGETGKNKKNR